MPRIRAAVRVRGRSFIAISLVPEAPLDGWLAALGEQLDRAPDVFAAKPVVVDLSALGAVDRGEYAVLFATLVERNIRVIGVEGIDAARQGADWPFPPLLVGGRPTPEPAEPAEPARPQPNAIIVARSVRSGQTVLNPAGDITIIGAVSSGAEIVAAGSIHVYGPLRGRAIAGFSGGAGARIFCRRLEAELLSIDGLYRTAEEMPAELRGQPVQAWLDGENLQIQKLP
jgi:septum site-determining protein MinC